MIQPKLWQNSTTWPFKLKVEIWAAAWFLAIKDKRLALIADITHPQREFPVPPIMDWGQMENGGDNEMSQVPFQHPARPLTSYFWGKRLSSSLLTHFSQRVGHQFLWSIFWINLTFAIPATPSLGLTITTSHVDHRGLPSGLLVSLYSV